MFFPGYAFLLFREEVSVHRLVKRCLSEEGKLYMFVSSHMQSNKKVSGHCRDMYILHTLVWVTMPCGGGGGGGAVCMLPAFCAAPGDLVQLYKRTR